MSIDAADPSRRAQARRISYFMLFRLVMLAAFTVLVGIVFTTERLPSAPLDEIEAAFVAPRLAEAQVPLIFGALAFGYALTIVYARWLPRSTRLDHFAGLQTGFDIVLSAIVVYATGGVESAFVSLYLISVLGAATMGGRRHTWAAAIACAVVFLLTSALEVFEIAPPLTTAPYVRPSGLELWNAIGRTLAAIVGVAVLSSYLTTQIASSVSLAGRFRALNEHIVRSLNSGLLTLDREDRLLYFNPAARHILDLDDDMIGRRIEEVLPDLPDVEARSKDPHGRSELEITTCANRSLHIGLSCAPLRDDRNDHVGWVINFQDVTRLHELAHKVRRNERLAALGELAASLAHEIRNPLAAISGSAELLGNIDLGPEDERLLAVIRRESTRLSQLVADILAFTRPRSPQPQLLDLETACREASEAFMADPSNVAVEVRFERGTSNAPDLQALVDPAQLSQILWNLMRNAAEAMSGSGQIVIRLHGQERFVTIEITDDGPGIAPEHLETIFDPFFTTKTSGTGFGLAIVHRIVGDHDGSVSVASTPGVGTTFEVTFPRATGTPRELADARDSGVLAI